ncbi:hypothetical protein FB451DRAFT_1021003 [Mycena latifolia]|nr:hypothetical protein FB451DRAFT_1021003 [Mycena latifolia]
MTHKCQRCGELASKRCSGCTLSNAWYCSADCQRRNWVKHIFECNPRRDINTTDYLALAVEENLFPEDLQTCKDFGFARAFSIENRSKLLGLYIGLIERLEVSPKKVRKWQMEGTLVENIKGAFSTLPEHGRGGYYRWFLDNQWVLDPRLPRPGDPADEMMLRCWQYVRGRDNTDTPEEIRTEMSKWPDEKNDCLLLCSLILSQMHPSPDLKIWIPFGFCACRNENDERKLAGMDIALFQRATFDDLYHAYDSSGLTALFDYKGLREQREAISIPYLEDVLRGSPGVFPSVWYLKQFVMAEEGNAPIPSITVDYGFMNCLNNEEETSLLKDLYTQIFALPRLDPMNLHEACIQGKLYDHVGQLLKLKKRDQKVLKRLLKNPYPLPDI